MITYSFQLIRLCLFSIYMKLCYYKCYYSYVKGEKMYCFNDCSAVFIKELMHEVPNKSSVVAAIGGFLLFLLLSRPASVTDCNGYIVFLSFLFFCSSFF